MMMQHAGASSGYPWHERASGRGRPCMIVGSLDWSTFRSPAYHRCGRVRVEYARTPSIVAQEREKDVRGLSFFCRSYDITSGRHRHEALKSPKVTGKNQSVDCRFGGVLLSTVTSDRFSV